MKTSDLLLVGGLLVVAYLVLRPQPQKVDPEVAAIQAGAGLLGKFGSWWSANYEFGTE